MNNSVNVNLVVDDYTNRVLGVVKEMYGLKDKGQALVKLAHMYGDDYIDRPVREEYAKKVLADTEAHFKKYGIRRKTKKDLNALFGVDQ